MLIDLATAKLDLRISHDAEDALVESFVTAAEEQAVLFLGRNVYATQEALDAARATAPAALAAASEAYDAALEAAGELTTQVEYDLAGRVALAAYREAQDAAERVQRGMVVNESVKTAILLTAASLWEHRGDEDAVIGVPPAARTFLFPFRVGMGV